MNSTGDHVHQEQRNEADEKLVAELIAQLRALDGGRESAETRALATALAAPAVDQNALVKATQEVAEKGPKYREYLQKFAEGVAKVGFEEAGKGLVNTLRIAGPILLEALRVVHGG